MIKRIQVTDIKLTTDRLLLRAFESKDLNDFFEYARVDGVGQKAGWQPHKSIEESEKILNIFLKERNIFAIVLDGKVIGSIGLHGYPEDLLPDLALMNGIEIGYVLSKDFWGQGLMTEAVKRIIKYLFEEEKLDFIFTSRFTENIPSGRVQEKCGFSVIGKFVRPDQNDKPIEHVASIISREDYIKSRK